MCIKMPAVSQGRQAGGQVGKDNSSQEAFQGQDCAARHTKLRPPAAFGLPAAAAAAALYSGPGGPKKGTPFHSSTAACQ